jgi:predicted Zn-dependent peptidase
MAHFLEHLVFKGGEKYATYKDVNETAERLGGVLNAYTSHDLVAFHITVRAESAPQAIDLLSDFVARPKLDAEELDRERGVVIQEINRAYDQPSTVAEYLIDKAAFGDHPLGRTVLGPEENLKSFTREAIVAFRERRWAGARGGAFLVGNVEHVPAEEELRELFGRFPTLGEPEPYVMAPAPAMHTTSSCEPVAPERPIAPMILLSSTNGIPPREAMTSSRRGGSGDLLDAAGRLDGLEAVRGDQVEARTLLLGVCDRARVRGRPDTAARLGP